MFSNLDRYLEIVKHFDVDAKRFFITLDSDKAVEQDVYKDNIADKAVLIEELGGEQSVKLTQERSNISDWLNFNALRNKALELEKTGKTEQLCLTVAQKVEKQISGLDSAKTLEMIKARDSQLRIALRSVNTEDLGIAEPTADDIDAAMKESKGNKPMKEDNDSFKKRFERIKEVMFTINRKFAEKEFSPVGYSLLF